jgi:hypothetical protein
VAVHADLRCRYAGKGRYLNRSMAIAAVDTEAAHVVSVAKLDRLRPDYVCIGYIRGTVDSCENPQKPDYEKKNPEDAYPRNSVRAWVKNLRHPVAPRR